MTTRSEAAEIAAAAGHEFSADEQPKAAEQKSRGQAAELLALARQRYRFICSDEGRAYAVAKEGPNRAIPMRGPVGVRVRLADAFALAHPGSVAAQSALTDVLAVLEGEASRSEPEAVYLRLARWQDGIVVDLGASGGRCVLVRPSGWSIEADSPIVFRRSALIWRIPEPARTPGGLKLLRDLLNTDDAGFRLLVGWLVCGLIPDISHPVLALRGEQGSAKSTAGRFLTMLIDPSPVPLRAAPRDLKQWAVTAAASWVVVLDNISSIPAWLSDVLCRAVTGEGIVDRALYSDDDVTVLAFRRAVALTSIGAGNLAGDLAERLLAVELQPIADDARRSEQTVLRAFDEARPAILGALLDLLSAVLAQLPAITLPRMPRMADFARVLAAIDAVEGWDTLSDYEAGAQDTAADVIEGSPFAMAVRKFAEQQGTWTGTAEQLREILPISDPLPRNWPPDATRVGQALSRYGPALRRQGITIDRGERSGRKRNRLMTISYQQPG
jgi:hypothetical protein